MLTEAPTFHTRHKLDQKIMDILDEDAANEEYLLDKVREAGLSEFSDSNIYSALLRVFTSMEFPEEEAELTWQEIINYKKTLSLQLKRDVGFRVAMLDYFININKKMINPKLIEIRLFAETEKLVLIDELTKLYNRRHFQNSLQREFKQAKRYNQPLSLLIIDIDNFKKINDTYGHPKGDEVLVKIAKTIGSNMRVEDTACRIGGEEFAVILPQTNEGNAMIAAQKLLESCRLIQIEDQNITVSGGIVSFPDKANTVDELFDFADRALYFAKYSGKNRIIAYSQDKRGSLRFDVNFELFCKLPDKSFKTMSKNISVTGIAFETDEPIDLHDLMEIKLHDETSGEQIEAKIKIVRKESSANDTFHIGAEFVELGVSSKELLKGLSRRKELSRR
jgi:diguanylate cyclase (GGDEF)-like protein